MTPLKEIPAQSETGTRLVPWLGWPALRTNGVLQPQLAPQFREAAQSNLGGREKGSSLNSAFLTPKPLASSVYVHVLEAPSPVERSILVTSPLPYPNRRRNCVGQPTGGRPGPTARAIRTVPVRRTGSAAESRVPSASSSRGRRSHVCVSTGGSSLIGPLPPSRDGRTAHSPGPAQGHGDDHGHASCRDGDGQVLRPLDRVGDDDPSQGPDDRQRVRRVPALDGSSPWGRSAPRSRVGP